MKKPNHGISIFILLTTFLLPTRAQDNVSVSVSGKTASMSNGLISIEINDDGYVNSLHYKGQDLIDSEYGGRFYFSYNDQNSYKELNPYSLRTVKESDDYAEVVYTGSSGSLKIEQGYILRKGVSGIYSYITLEGTGSDVKLREMRIAYRVSPDIFYYGYVNERMQGELPSVAVMKEVNDQSIMDATYPLPDGSIYTKYNWADYVEDDAVHGIMSNKKGLWAITPSTEYLNGGPMKQELTVHATNKTPIVLHMLQGEHFGASAQYYRNGDKKIYGPFLLYVNKDDNRDALVTDAKMQAAKEKAEWPYEWFTHDLYPTNRSLVSGRINLPKGMNPDNIQVVLAQPDNDIYDQGKGYIFSGETDRYGRFKIRHVREGNYTLYAYALKGEITETFKLDDISVSGNESDLGIINWPVEKYKLLLWQIGDNNRLSSEFMYSDTIRAYGLYELPEADLNYKIGTSKPESHWYFAQTKRGIWTVTFDNNENPTGNAKLTASIAGAAASPNVDVYVNNAKKASWSFGNDASVYRSAVQSGAHEIRSFTFPASDLKIGSNTVQFKMTDVGSRGGVMYDCIKLEAGEVNVPKFDTLNLDTVAGTENIFLEEPQANRLSITGYPNPASDRCTFVIKTQTAKHMQLSLYNLYGQLVDVIYDAPLHAGRTTLTYDLPHLPQGVYIYKLRAGEKILTGKINKTSSRNF